MRIIDIITAQKPSLSFEVFPPKTDTAFESVRSATEALARLKPDYMSVTYGAGGGTSAYTIQTAQHLQEMGVPALAHLSCVSSTKKEIQSQLQQLKNGGITNILALRGDIPKGMEQSDLEYRYASQLIEEIKEFGGFCIGGACYPESHPESETCTQDVAYLKKKVESGCEFLTTQMFFDNNILYNFMYRIREAGISVPVVAGIMPVTNAIQVKRICSISGTALPQRFRRIVDRYGAQPDAMKQAGIAYATEQIIDLYANGINAVHVYTMNKPDVAERILQNISQIIR